MLGQEGGPGGAKAQPAHKLKPALRKMAMILTYKLALLGSCSNGGIESLKIHASGLIIYRCHTIWLILMMQI